MSTRGTDDTNPATTPGPSRAAYVGLGVAAVVLGVATAVGVWLFNEAFGLVHRVVFDGPPTRSRRSVPGP